MILVNDPGDPHEVYPPLRHADWSGWTLADLVFPNFLFLSGASLVFSLAGRVGRGASRWELARGLGRRSVNLMLLKLFVAQFPTFRRRRIRIFGVLFRTALCSLLGGLILLGTLSIETLVGIIAALLAGYWVALRFVPIPGCGLPGREVPLLDREDNLAAWLDRRVAHLLHGHLHNGALYNVTHDPEGLLSSMPALATVLMGSCAALILRSRTMSPARRVTVLAGAGTVGLAFGRAWGRSFPINKNLWTSSYALVAGGWSLLTLAALYAVFDARKPERALAALAAPAKILGANALVAYALSVVGHKLARTIHVEHEEHQLSLRTYAYRKVFARKHSTPLRSLAFAVACVALCFLPNLLLWKRKIFVKV